jgi:two-component system, cell cycle response regulator
VPSEEKRFGWGPAFSHLPKAVPDQAQSVLCIHEDEQCRRWLADTMRSEGYEVDETGSTTEAILMVAQLQPDLVILALDGKGKAGLELCGELRMLEVSRDVPILLVSREPATEEAIARGLLAGADDYVAAWQRPTELRARVRVQLRNKRYRDALRRVRGERENFRRQAALDPLTGLLNRRSLSQIIEEKVSTGQTFAVLFIDADHFKSINDRLGHAIGDTVLRNIADCLRRGTRAGDYCGRYGGEEFVIVASLLEAEQLFGLAERHRQAVGMLHVAELSGTPLTVSIGAALYEPASGEPASSLLHRADAALYAAKSNGRNRVELAELYAPAAPRTESGVVGGSTENPPEPVESHVPAPRTESGVVGGSADGRESGAR